VTAFKDTIIAECPFMIKNNETESKVNLGYSCTFRHLLALRTSVNMLLNAFGTGCNF
jgi:hypothetical protein